MVTKVVINNNEDTPIEYLSGLRAFKNGKTYEFKPGVNIIVEVSAGGLFRVLCRRVELQHQRHLLWPWRE